MITRRRRLQQALFATVAALTLSAVFSSQALAASAEDLSRDASQALQTLYETNPTAELISKKAKAVLVPKIVKAGLVFAGNYGEGVSMKAARVNGDYNSVSASWGWQAGADSYACVVFLMSDKAVDYLDKSKGWVFGVGPNVVIVNAGVAKNLSTSTLKDDACAYITDQRGLMASLSFEGTKISRIKR